MTTNPILERYRPLVNVVAQTFGNNCEVVLHDFSNLQNSIVEIANGHVTGRSIGSPVPEDSLKRISEGQLEDVINYTGKSAEGRVLKSSTTFIRDDQGKVIGCFCINFDMTELVVAQKVLNDIMSVTTNVDEADASKSHTINDVLMNIVSSTIDAVGKPVAYLTKEEKVQIVDNLDNQGAFLIKGAIDYVAKILCVSRYTIYNYLDEIRVEKN
ncbi:MAG: PAS domain-containing protein [Clostridia bacterium]|nr:PAS domain-containing protein [Clostridia bacterium]